MILSCRHSIRKNKFKRTGGRPAPISSNPYPFALVGEEPSVDLPEGGQRRPLGTGVRNVISLGHGISFSVSKMSTASVLEMVEMNHTHSYFILVWLSGLVSQAHITLLAFVMIGRGLEALFSLFSPHFPTRSGCHNLDLCECCS